MATSSYLISSSSSHDKSFHVFPSFHGPDVRTKFISHLHIYFVSKGITAFKDHEIKRGHTIGSELVKAIREARVSIVVLSTNYASSSWCLDELVEILKCKEASTQIVMPIFYDVDPSDVRKQKGDVGIAFQKSCEGKTEEKKKIWSKALADVANIAGEHSSNWPDEAAMLQKLSTDVSNKLKVELLKEEFRSIDKDGDGFITTAELRYAMTKDGNKVSDEKVDTLIRAADVNYDGRISNDEFVKILTANLKAPTEENMKLLFRIFDKERRGTISAAGFRHVLTGFGKKLTDKDIRNFIRRADADGDGQINYDEFIKFCTKPHLVKKDNRYSICFFFKKMFYKLIVCQSRLGGSKN